jgi:hypothetical protein
VCDCRAGECREMEESNVQGNLSSQAERFKREVLLLIRLLHLLGVLCAWSLCARYPFVRVVLDLYIAVVLMLFQFLLDYYKFGMQCTSFM